MSKKQASTRTPIVFEDESFDFQFIRALSSSVVQMADVNECVMTAKKIENGNVASWYQEWYTIAERIHALADEALKNGHTVSALSAFLRASNYYRSSEFYLHGNPNDPRIRDASQKSRACFAAAIPLMPMQVVPVEIPYEGTMLPGYFYAVDNKKRPTIMIQTGFDGTQEEKYVYAIEAVKRGYHVLTFEGPGQGHVLREQGLTFRPDWEVVIRAVVDFVVTQEVVDPSMLILYGLSFGGYFAPRGASGEDRIKILVANGGFYDLVGALAAINGNTKEGLLKDVKKDEAAFDRGVREVMKARTAVRFFIEHGMYSFGAKTPSELMLKGAEYTLKDRAELIKSTTVIVDSDEEMDIFEGQARLIYDHLACPKTYMLFTAAEAAGPHCQSGALLLSTGRIYDWLDKTVHAMTKE